MTASIFRKAALNRLASPEQLDRPVRIVRPAGWIALGALTLAALAGAAWAAVATAPVKVGGQGIIIQQGGLAEIRAADAGRIETLDLAPGQRVQAGDIVATIVQNDLARQLENARASLIAASDRLESLTEFFADSARREAISDQERIDTITETGRLLKQRLGLLEQKLANTRRLVTRGTLVRDRLLDAQVAVSDVRERISTLGDEASLIRLRQLERESERRIQLLDQRLKVEELEREVARADKLFADRRKVETPHGGVVVEVKVNPGDVVQPGAALATIAPDDGVGGPQLYGVLYVAPGDGKQVKPGMRVELSPTSVRREEFGYMIGVIEAISPLPATAEGMRRTLQNDELARTLAAAGAPFEARVALTPDPATPSGFRWSSSRGPDLEIGAGALFEARVVVRHVRLATFIAPGFDQVVDDAAEAMGVAR